MVHKNLKMLGDSQSYSFDQESSSSLEDQAYRCPVSFHPRDYQKSFWQRLAPKIIWRTCWQRWNRWPRLSIAQLCSIFFVVKALQCGYPKGRCSLESGFFGAGRAIAVFMWWIMVGVWCGSWLAKVKICGIGSPFCVVRIDPKDGFADVPGDSNFSHVHGSMQWDLNIDLWGIQAYYL